LFKVIVRTMVKFTLRAGVKVSVSIRDRAMINPWARDPASVSFKVRVMICLFKTDRSTMKH
jgi:hypothetical protein